MKKQLLSPTGQFYKANLHCHSTMSDGSLTPEQIKTIYQQQGYSIVAYTDHELLFPQNHLTDETFLALNGVEHDVNDLTEPIMTKRHVCHFCCIALEPDNHLTPFPDESRYCKGNLENLHLAKPIPGTEGSHQTYTPEAISHMMETIQSCGFFVTYNHPHWSLETPDIFCQYHGMNAMEIANNACITMGYEDYNPQAYDALLQSGHRIFCVADDDNHNKDCRNWDSFGGWTMIKADKLDYRTITKALQNGNFYASQGPEIYDLWVEDQIIHITCSDAASIHFTTGQRHRQKDIAPQGESLTEASFQLDPNDGYVRVTVTDHRGNHANTNAYFLDTIL